MPPSSHFIFIPAVLILGIVLGFIIGARATRDQLALEQRRAEERAKRKADRAATAGQTISQPGDPIAKGD